MGFWMDTLPQAIAEEQEMDYQEAIEGLRASTASSDAVMAMAWGISTERDPRQAPTGIDVTLANRAYQALNAAGFRVVKL